MRSDYAEIIVLQAFTIVALAIPGPWVIAEESISRAYTVTNSPAESPVFSEAISRAYTVVNQAAEAPAFAEAISRAYTVVQGATTPPAFDESISRAYTVVLTVRSDFDQDADVDGDDYGHLEACASGPAIPQDEPTCTDAKLDEDADVDQSDFGLFQRCLTGPWPEAIIALDCED